MSVPDHCTRCHQRLDETNRPLTENYYGCEACRGKRPELLKSLGQEDDADQNSKAESG